MFTLYLPLTCHCQSILTSLCFWSTMLLTYLIVFFLLIPILCNFQILSPLSKFLYTDFKISMSFLLYGSFYSVFSWHPTIARLSSSLPTKARSSSKGVIFYISLYHLQYPSCSIKYCSGIIYAKSNMKLEK